jgi:hypothetical protein
MKSADFLTDKNFIAEDKRISLKQNWILATMKQAALRLYSFSTVR